MPAPTDSAGDVVGGVGNAVARELGRLRVGHRAPLGVDALDLGLPVVVVVAVEEDVVLLLQLAGADLLVADVGVRDLLRSSAMRSHPVASVSDHRCQTAMRGIGDGWAATDGTAAALSNRRPSSSATAERGSEAGLRRQDPRARRVIETSRLESLLRDRNLETRKTKARGEQRLLPGVLEQIDRTRPGDSSGHRRGAGHGRQGSRHDLRVVDALGLQAVVDRAAPRRRRRRARTGVSAGTSAARAGRRRSCGRAGRAGPRRRPWRTSPP